MKRLVAAVIVALLPSAAQARSKFCTDTPDPLPAGSEMAIWQARSDAACRDRDGDDTNHGPNWKLLHAMDRPDLQGKEIARAWLVANCLIPYNHPLPRYLACGYDARRLNRAGFDAEVKSLALDKDEAARLKDVWELATQRAAEVKGLVEQDGGDTPKLVIEGPERAIAADEAALAADAEQVALFAFMGHAGQLLLDRALRNTYEAVPLEGCDENAQKLAALVAAQHPKTPDDVRRALFGSRLVWLRMHVDMYCAAAHTETPHQLAYREIMSHQPFLGGPRAAAFIHVAELLNAPDASYRTGLGRAEVNDLEARQGWDESTLYSLGLAANRFNSDHMQSVIDDPDDADREPNQRRVTIGHVKAIKPAEFPAVMAVTFKEEKWTVPTYKCSPTGRIAGWESDGTPILDRNCVEVGEETLSMTPPSVMLSPTEAGKLKPGMLVKYTYPRFGDVQDAINGYVYEVDEGKGKTQHAVSYFGFPLEK